MTSPYDEEIEDLLALYRRQRAEAVEARRRINEVTGTATAPRQTVKATVNAQGEVTAIEFPTGAYHRMTPKELSEALLTTIRQARANALEAVAEVGSLGLPAGVKITDLVEGRVDATAVLEDEPGMPESVREYIAGGRPDVRRDGAR
ncbi:YbaB/EbfC family nucleoid-associated protein [Streptomyces sp. NPDC004393]|uniref:YbaB/EbfC family nucleoid-associated protein n=1 Tax=Streptomyces sp. NPDC004533 TaxID=3154278 RepID=UPI0033ACD157